MTKRSRLVHNSKTGQIFEIRSGYQMLLKQDGRHGLISGQLIIKQNIQYPDC
jgi:hypothetical protein